MIDEAMLLAHLKGNSKQYEHQLLIVAVCDALATAIRRGDFEEKKEVE